MRYTKYWLTALVALSLATMACLGIDLSGITGGGAQPGAGAPQQAPPGACDAPAEPTGLGSTVSGHINATDQGYPANCTYYCTSVPSGTGTLNIGVSGFTEDLDLYVGFGTIASIQGQDSSQADWSSNEFGTGAENVSITAPQAGNYYIEICSYNSTASDFTLTTSGQ